ncbi:MAG: DUF1318 domain-containing protein [Alphaproteobacteria bacterium]
MIRLVVLLVAALGLSACQTQSARDLPPAPAAPKVRPGQQVAVTNAVAKELADEHTKAREPGRGAAVESLKDAGRVVENTHGYLQPLDTDATEQVRAIVAQVNDDRRVIYQRLALQQKLDLAIVEAIAGDARTSGEQPGRLVLDANGQTVRR